MFALTLALIQAVAAPGGMPRLPGYDARTHVSVPMRMDVWSELSPKAKDAYVQTTLDALRRSPELAACKLDAKTLREGIDARYGDGAPLMGAVAEIIYGTCY